MKSRLQNFLSMSRSGKLALSVQFSAQERTWRSIQRSVKGERRSERRSTERRSLMLCRQDRRNDVHGHFVKLHELCMGLISDHERLVPTVFHVIQGWSMGTGFNFQSSIFFHSAYIFQNKVQKQISV